MSLNLNEDFKPSENLKGYYRAASSLILLVPAIVTIGTFLGVDTGTALVASGIVWALFLMIYGFVQYWITKFYDSITFRLADQEVVVEKGVWIKKVQNVPYSRIMNITTEQGPIYRHFNLGKAKIETAGHSGKQGGPEASIFGVENFKEVADHILKIVRARKGTAALQPETAEEMETSDVLSELKKIRRILEESSEP